LAATDGQRISGARFRPRPPPSGRLAHGDGELIGLTHQTATLDTAGTMLALTLINKEHATVGTQVTVT
jgi:hypothetical protein